MSRMATGPRLHPLAPESDYRVELTLEAADDLDTALNLYRSRGNDRFTSFVDDFFRAMERIAAFPHLARRHHDDLRLTALSQCPYRVWFVLDDEQATALVVGLFPVSHDYPEKFGLPRGPARIWWHSMPYLPPLLPDPYPEDAWSANPQWVEEDDQWWVSRMEPRV